MNKTPSVYIAGPDIFRPGAKRYYDTVERICASLQLRALVPLDPSLRASGQCSERNKSLIRQADGMVANLEAFRGADSDSRTAYEVGFADALEKPVVGYLTDHREMFDKTVDYHRKVSRAYLGRTGDEIKPHSGFVFPDGMTAECRGYPVNLMLQHGCRQIIKGTVSDALIVLRGQLHEYW